MVAFRQSLAGDWRLVTGDHYGGGLASDARFTHMFTPHPDGVVVTVWVVPGASRDQVVGEHDGALKVRTVAPAEGGKANSRVAEMVAEAVGGRSGSLVAGYASRRKQILVIGVIVADAAAALVGGEERRKQSG